MGAFTSQSELTPPPPSLTPFQEISNINTPSSRITSEDIISVPCYNLQVDLTKIRLVNFTFSFSLNVFLISCHLTKTGSLFSPVHNYTFYTYPFINLGSYFSKQDYPFLKKNQYFLCSDYVKWIKNIHINSSWLDKNLSRKIQSPMTGPCKIKHNI